MPNTDSNITSEPTSSNKKPFLQSNMPLVAGVAIVALSSGLLGYSVGHRQGLTVVGYDADAEQLVDVVQTASFNTAQVDVYGSNNHAYVYQGGN